MPIIGKISKFMPNGFESTGVTLVITLYNVTGVVSNMIDAYELKIFDIKSGYYDRVWKAITLNAGFLVFLMLIFGVFFVGDERKLEKLKEKEKPSKK